MDHAARDRVVSNVTGHLSNGVSEPVLKRAFEYWRNIDKELGYAECSSPRICIGDRIERAVRDAG